MKKLLITLTILFVFCKATYAQETVPVEGAATAGQATVAETNEVIAKVNEQKKADKELKKAEKAQKKAEKSKKRADREIKKREQKSKAINKKIKSIERDEQKIAKIEAKFSKNKLKGKLSPIDELEMRQDIDKMKLNVLRDKEQLAKMQRKQ